MTAYSRADDYKVTGVVAVSMLLAAVAVCYTNYLDDKRRDELLRPVGQGNTTLETPQVPAPSTPTLRRQLIPG